MNPLPADEIQKDLEHRAEKRRRKKSIRMKVSGQQVRNLQRLIINRSKKVPPQVS